MPGHPGRHGLPVHARSTGPRPHRSRSGTGGVLQRRHAGDRHPGDLQRTCERGEPDRQPAWCASARTAPPRPGRRCPPRDLAARAGRSGPAAGPSAPGGRWIVIRRTVRGCRQPMVRTGCASMGLADPGGRRVTVERGPGLVLRVARVPRRRSTHAPGRGWFRRYLLTSEGTISTAEPRSVGRAAARAVNAWSKPYCSSVGSVSAGEHTHRSRVRMHPDGHGWALASTTAAGRPAGTAGATITRLARHPGHRDLLDAPPGRRTAGGRPGR